MTPSLLKLLRTVDTPTVCNAIEVVQGGRGFNQYTKGTMHHSDPGAPATVGRARTAKISGIKPPTEAPDIIKVRRQEYYRNMAGGEGSTVAIIEDLDAPNCVAGWWGEVHTAVHKGLGLAGAITNGVMRDLDVMEPDFPVLAGSIGVSHAFVHVREVGTPVKVFDLKIVQGDWVHADRHGALVIPNDVLEDLERGIKTVISNEAIIIGPAREPGFDIDKLEQAWAKFEKVRT